MQQLVYVFSLRLISFPATSLEDMQGLHFLSQQLIFHDPSPSAYLKTASQKSPYNLNPDFSSSSWLCF